MSINIIGELGINAFFGSDQSQFLSNAKKLIDICSVAGLNYVKLQKRNPDLCVPEEQKKKEKVVPWRSKPTTYLQYKRDIEFSKKEYKELFEYCRQKGIELFASVWDTDSAMFMREFTDLVKIPSAMVTNKDLLNLCYELFPRRMISTGMSTEEEIKEAVNRLKPHVIFHTNSVYPSPVEDLYMKYILWLKHKYPEIDVGYSNHYYGLIPSIASTFLGVKWIEIHVTLCHQNWGSDQLSSVEPAGIFKLVKGIRDLEKSFTGDCERILFPGEEIKKKTLRK